MHSHSREARLQFNANPQMVWSLSPCTSEVTTAGSYHCTTNDSSDVRPARFLYVDGYDNYPSLAMISEFSPTCYGKETLPSLPSDHSLPRLPIMNVY